MTGSNHLRRTVPALSLLALATLGLAACGGSTGYGGAAPAAPTGAASGVGIHVASTADGSVLVDGNGRTLYLLTADANNRSNCTGACVAAWPVVAPSAAPAPAVTAKVASMRRADGTPQVTVNGMPVYTYAADHSPGDVNGEGVASFGGTWWVLAPNGTAITSPMKAPVYGRY